MHTKSFAIGDVLTVVFGQLLTPNGMTAVYEILKFMTGEDPNTSQIPRFIDECRPHLLVQFPELDSPEMQFAVAELREMLKTPAGRAEPDKLLLGWLSKLTCGKYGIKVKEMFDVSPIPVIAR